MPTITLQSRLLLDNSTENQDHLLFIQTVHESLTNSIVSRLITNKLKSWNEIKNNYPEIATSVDDEITKNAPYYFRSYKYELKALSNKRIIKFNLRDAEIFESLNIKEIDKLKVAVYFYSEPFTLVNSFGSYILLSELNDKGNANTFMLELSPDLAINSYH
jgi:hypothetical protein